MHYGIGPVNLKIQNVQVVKVDRILGSSVLFGLSLCHSVEVYFIIVSAPFDLCHQCRSSPKVHFCLDYTWRTVDVTEWGGAECAIYFAERDRSGGYWCSCGMFTVTLWWLFLDSFRGTPTTRSCEMWMEGWWFGDDGEPVVGGTFAIHFILQRVFSFLFSTHSACPVRGLTMRNTREHLSAFLFILILRFGRESNS